MSVVPGSNESYSSVLGAGLESVFGAGSASVLGSKFLTSRELGSVAQVSTSDSSFVDERLSRLLQDYKKTLEAMPRMDGGDSAYTYLKEAEKAVITSLPAGTSETKKNALIARTFFSFLRQDLGMPNLPNHIEGLLKAVSIDEWLQFIDMTSVFAVDLQSKIAEHTAAINDMSSQLTDEHVRAIVESLVSEDYERASRAQILAILPPEGRNALQALLNGNGSPSEMMIAEMVLNSFPLAVIENRDILGEEGFASLSEAMGQLCYHKLSRDFLTSQLEITNLPHTTLAEIKIKSQRLQNWAYNNPFFSGQFEQTDLQLSKKGLKTTVPGISLFTNCVSINLSNNKFRTVPVLPTRLESLDLSGNPLLRFGNLTALSQLKNLYLDKTGLKRVPKEVFSLPKLEDLSLSDSNLVTVPDEIVYVPRVRLAGTSLMYASPAAIAHLSNDSCSRDAVKNLQEELLYPAFSPLGKLYKQFVKPESEYNLDEIKLSLAAVSEDDRNLIYEMVWRESGAPETSDGSWGEHHVFDDLNVLARAVRSAVLAKHERLSFEQKNEAHLRLATIADIGSIGWYLYFYNAWAQTYAKNSLSRLADAMSFDIPVIVQVNRLFLAWQMDFLKDASIILMNFMRVNKWIQLADGSFSELDIVRQKIRLKNQWDAFHSITKPTFETQLAENNASYPEVIASALIQIQTHAPAYIFQSKELLLAELEEAYRRIRTVQPEDYTGTNFEVEKEYSARNPLADLFKLFVQKAFSRDDFHRIMEHLSQSDRNFIYQQVWNLTETRDATLVEDADKIDWGREHALDNVRTLGLSVQAAIHAKFNALSQEQKNSVYGEIYRRAGSPHTEGFEPWGETHALDSLSRLADAMHAAEFISVAGPEALLAMFFGQQGGIAFADVDADDFVLPA